MEIEYKNGHDDWYGTHDHNTCKVHTWNNQIIKSRYTKSRYTNTYDTCIVRDENWDTNWSETLTWMGYILELASGRRQKKIRISLQQSATGLLKFTLLSSSSS